MNRMSTRTHGLLDYLSVFALILVPRILRWNSKTTNLLTGMAAGTFAYSAATRYEWGAFKFLPMRTHLILDFFSGLFMIMSPRLFKIRNPIIEAALISFGVFEMTAATMTDAPPELPAEEFLVPLDVESYVNM